MKNQETITETKMYRVYDEMACETIVETDDANLAIDTAYNYQAVLIENATGRVISDYSC